MIIIQKFVKKISVGNTHQKTKPLRGNMYGMHELTNLWSWLSKKLELSFNPFTLRWLQKSGGESDEPNCWEQDMMIIHLLWFNPKFQIGLNLKGKNCCNTNMKCILTWAAHACCVFRYQLALRCEYSGTKSSFSDTHLPCSGGPLKTLRCHRTQIHPFPSWDACIVSWLQSVKQSTHKSKFINIKRKIILFYSLWELLISIIQASHGLKGCWILLHSGRNKSGLGFRKIPWNSSEECSVIPEKVCRVEECRSALLGLKQEPPTHVQVPKYPPGQKLRPRRGTCNSQTQLQEVAPPALEHPQAGVSAKTGFTETLGKKIA